MLRPIASAASAKPASETSLVGALGVAFRTFLDLDLLNLDMAVRLRQVADLARQTPILAAGNLGTGAIVAWVFWDRLPHWAVATWLGLFLALSFVELKGLWQRRGRPAPDAVGRRVIMKATCWSFVSGSLWGIAAVYAFPLDIAVLQLVIAFVVIGLAAGAVASMAMQPVACLAFVVPSIAPLFVMFAVEGGPVAPAMAAMIGLYFFVLTMALLNGFLSFVKMVHAKIENRSLASGLAESQEANRAKSLFLANMSHELRTPLNAIIGFAEIIKDERFGPVGSAQYCDYARDIHSSGEHLLAVISDVLDMSRLDMDKLAVDERELDVADAVRGAVRFIILRANEAGLALSADLPADLPTLLADEVRLKQVLINLLSNAVKFTKRDGKVLIQAEVLANGGLAIRVIDTGIGMTKDEITIAMEPFRQVENSLSRSYDGTGLGLPLARGLVELHGGSLDLTSAPGVGTTATVTFPPFRVLSSEIERRTAVA